MKCSPINFKSCFVTLSKTNNSDYTQKEVIEKFNSNYSSSQDSEKSHSVNLFIPAAGEGTRFKIAKLLGNYNKINMPISLGGGKYIHPLDFVMIMSKPFIDTKGIQTVTEDTPKGSFSGVIKYYSDGNEIKDTIVCSADSMFDRPIADFFSSSIRNPKTHLCVVGAKRTPQEVDAKYGILDVNPKTSGLKGFIEKPDIETALMYSKNGQNIVNTGCYYFSRDAIMRLLDEIKNGENNIKKNEKELYDYALAIKYVHSKLSDWFSIKPEEASILKITDDWVDIGEPKGFYGFAEMVKNGRFTSSFPRKTSKAIKRAFEKIFRFDKKIPYINFTDTECISNARIEQAKDIDGIKIVV